MNSFTDSLALDDQMEIGLKVEARWTNSGSYYSAPATVSKINAKSVKVTLDEAVETGYGEGYPVGWTITCPRAMNLRDWSHNNGIFPVGS